MWVLYVVTGDVGDVGRSTLMRGRQVWLYAIYLIVYWRVNPSRFWDGESLCSRCISLECRCVEVAQ